MGNKHPRVGLTGILRILLIFAKLIKSNLCELSRPEEARWAFRQLKGGPLMSQVLIPRYERITGGTLLIVTFIRGEGFGTL